MADVKELNINNTTYTIKDAVARSGLTGKQDTLVSGTNIKTINSQSILGSGDITIQGGGASRNIGEIVASTIPLTDAGLHLLDGALISGSGSYSDFVDYIADLYDSTQPSEYQYNINVIGSLTNNNGIISGFNSSNYATLPQNFNTSNSFECVVSFTTGASVSDEAVLGNYETYINGATNFYGVNMYIVSGYLAVAVGDGTSAPIFHDETQAVSVNTSYKVKLTFDGSDYKYYLAVGSGDYSLIKTTTSSATMVYNTNYPSYLGCWYVGHMSQLYSFFSGSINLNESYIKINDTSWWVGAEEIKPIFCTEAQWQSSIATYGVCGKFVYDSVNNTVRLPKITGFTESTITPAELGDLVEAGLPNIMGTFNAAQDVSPSGAFQTDYSGHVPYARGDWYSYVTSFNASRSSSIYGNSSTVQPQAIKVLYYIVIATSTKTDIQVDIDVIATDLNGKADVDLTNVNNSGTSRGASWAMPSTTYIDVTVGASGATYTAPANGYFIVFAYFPSQSSYIQLGGDRVLSSITPGNSGYPYLGTFLPVEKGQSMPMYYSNVTFSFFRFFYAIGSESEAS